MFPFVFNLPVKKAFCPLSWNVEGGSINNATRRIHRHMYANLAHCEIDKYVIGQDDGDVRARLCFSLVHGAGRLHIDRPNGLFFGLVGQPQFKYAIGLVSNG